MKHQWVDPEDARFSRVCSQCGYRIPVDVDQVFAMAVADDIVTGCPGRIEPVLYSIEKRHLEDLRTIARRLSLTRSFRSESTIIMGVVRFAEALRQASIVATTVEVCCPHCGEPQPAPDNGSHAWVPSQVVAEQGRKVCVACDEPFQLNEQNRVTVQS